MGEFSYIDYGAAAPFPRGEGGFFIVHIGDDEKDGRGTAKSVGYKYV